ncbi:hypothetical protein CIW49_24485 [Mycolicibacterium sp. P1-18]|nr:hypothetical protein CIW49_24485 [Mycolicibacterium sp. P1-18]
MSDVAESLVRVDGETGLEFCQGAGLLIVDELKNRQAETGTVSELIVMAVMAKLQQTCAEAYLDLKRPRSEIEGVLRAGLRELHRQAESWVNDGLNDDQIAAQQAAYEVEIERSNAVAARAVPEARRKPTPMDFDELLEAQGGETRMIIFEIARVVTPELFAFMLNVPSDRVFDHIPNDTQREVIGELTSILRQLPGYEYELSDGAIGEALISYQSELKSSQATHFHVKCGGLRPPIDDDGSLDSALQIVAMDVVAARLCDESTLMRTLATHPLHRELVLRVMKEGEPIAALFTRAAEADSNLDAVERQMAAYYMNPVIAHWTDGSGGSLDVRHVPEALIASLRLTCDTSDDVLREVCDSVAESLTQARELAAGGPVNAVAYVGLCNVALDDDVPRIELPNMMIRRPSVFEKHAVPSFVKKATLVAEVSTELQLRDVTLQSMSMNDDPKEILREFAEQNERSITYADKRKALSESLPERVLQLRFAIALASPQRRLLGPVWVYTIYRNPLTGHGGNSLGSAGAGESNFRDQAIDRLAAERVARYFVPTDNLHASLRLARTRILQALSERGDVIDCFIDFVIAWESVVGYSESTTFLVSAAMSTLLSPDDVEKRRDLFNQVKKLYGHRSAVVHGSAGRDAPSKSFKITEVSDYATQAGRLAIDTFKRVLERPELLDLDTQERVRMVLLGFPK